ncbi:hypothetical protein N7481_009294 [Penicillium waksmanii]|uniref:uncharacterized protein n=1 Tax=Penicillium waksmanii TaxID=69791 RepID=UPI00254824C3|nr:uncharacterized protein N7481_009294 [Penicillium waksmanii]KAJ5975587.1 hypothetical protein N7481_009294 [Penicillium waksmanii]
MALSTFSEASSWRWMNYDSAATTPVGQDVAIYSPPDTDIWRPSMDKNNFTAPYLYTQMKSSEFQSVSVTVQADWKTLFDQGGIAITFPRDDTPLQWIKAGIEYTDGAPYLGVVATQSLSDWSLSPMLNASDSKTATIEIVRDKTDAWVYVHEGTSRRSLRQITWAFNEDTPEYMHVGLYAAKPTRESESGHELDKLAVTFKSFSLRTMD